MPPVPNPPPGLQQFVHFLGNLPPLVAVPALLVAAWLADLVVRRVLLRIAAKLAAASPLRWDDAIARRGALRRLAHAVPALVLLVGIGAIGGMPAWVYPVVRNVSLAYVALTVALAIGNLLDAANDVYETHGGRARERPVKGYVQLAKLLVWIIAAILMIAALANRSPMVLLTGLGAMTAVLMLVFKDTILSLVASVQLGSNDMLRVGDWIEMPGLGIDGDVVDISLHTVKVQNWDKTISTIPTHQLISGSYRNWRGMTDAGGRRIKRALLLDQASVRFLDAEERKRLRRLALIDAYLDRQRDELEAYNARLEAAGKDPVNNRRATNLGTFRAYVTAYLRSHPGVNQHMTLMARQLAPTPQGLPMEIYCFSADTDWVAYENLSGDIFDHLLAVLPEFGLRIYQQPGGGDLAAVLSRLAAAGDGQEPAESPTGISRPGA